jgi:hypothetical protein
MTRSKKPEAYKMVARSRQDIVAAIISMTDQRTYHYDPYYLCFNVKLYDCDLSLKNLLKHFKDQEGDHLGMHNRDWLRQIKERYDEIGENTLYEWGIETARGSFVGSGRDGKPDDDMFNHLWDGTELDVDYAFVGRSGGWLAIAKFEGFSFDRRMDADLETELMEMEFSTLKKLYQLVLMLKHDLRQEAIKLEVEVNAAFDFFANACADIKQPDEVQPELFRTQEEIEEEVLA